MLCGLRCAPIAPEKSIAAASQAPMKLDRISRFIFPFSTQESPVGSPKMSEQPKLERSALFVLILVGWTSRRFRLAFLNPPDDKCTAHSEEQDLSHQRARATWQRKDFPA